MFDIEEELKNLPDKPGVYIMRNKNERVIYVGKAKILKNRVRQYFQKSANHTPKVLAMVSQIESFEYIVTNSEIEALVLECTLIKKYRPKYNILLKDDKQYPYIKVTLNEDWPKIFKTRTLKNDGAKYFGPYMGTNTIKHTLAVIQKIFTPPTCKRVFPRDIKKGRPCLNYHIKNCFAPCTGNVTNKEYRQVFCDICSFLEGDHKKLISELENQMREYSKNLEFEKAGAIRDKIKAINVIDEKQRVLNAAKQEDKDIIAVSRDEQVCYAQVFLIRGGRLYGRENYRIDNIEEQSVEEIITDFLKQFYQDATYIPKEIITQYPVLDEETIVGWLSSKRGNKVTITNPKRGEKLRLVEMTAKNADIALKNHNINQARLEDKKETAFKTGKFLGLDTSVRYIEAFDISNILGNDNVASMVVFENGKAKRSRYRRFKIKSFEGADDYRAMQEVLYRRLNEARVERELVDAGELNIRDAKFLPLPDVFFVDGGKGHVTVAKEMLDMTECDIPVFGMVKDEHHRTRGLVSLDGEISVSPNSEFFHMITRIQDEVHRFAITYHRSLRDAIKSELDEISGIGDTRKKALFEHFGSIDKIKNATFDELMEVKSMDKKSAKSVIYYFNTKKVEE